jgi:pyruvate dehydrogenase E1 component beta subunit
MSGGQFTLPVVFRGPGGSAHQLAAQHSQSTEALWAHVPGLKVVMPANPKDAKGLLKSAIRDDNPVVFIEGEMLYNLKGEVPDEEYTIPLGVADVKRTGSDVTLVCHSKTVAVALKAAEQLAANEIQAEVVDLRTIRPLDERTVLESVAKTHRCVVVEEGWHFAGVGAQVVDVIQRDAFDELDAPVLRVTGADVPMPYNKHLEKASKADPAKVIAAVERVLYLS